MSVFTNIRHLVLLPIVMGIGTIALGETIAADLQLPAARIMAAESRGFDALATASHEASIGTTPICKAIPQGVATVDSAAVTRARTSS